MCQRPMTISSVAMRYGVLTPLLLERKLLLGAYRAVETQKKERMGESEHVIQEREERST